MYKQIETQKVAYLHNMQEVYPVATLEDEAGAIAHFIIDDHCYVLVLEWNGGVVCTDTGNLNKTQVKTVRPTYYIFAEAFEVLKTLPSLNPA